MCHFLNVHNNHKIIRIEDEEALRKEKLSIEDSTKDFDVNKNRIEELKKKIENELLELDKLYDKVNKEVTESYKLNILPFSSKQNKLRGIF